MRAARVLFACTAAIAIAACASGGTRDVVPETHDVQISGAQARGNYVYVAKRPTGFVALSGEEGLGMDLATATVDRLADRLDACATELARSGKLVDGAIRLTVLVNPDGTSTPSRVTVSPGDAVAANALLCVMSPLRMMTFAPAGADGGGRAFSIDATWGPGAKG